MKSTLIMTLCFLIGVSLGRSGILPGFIAHSETTLWALYLLLILVGIGAGASMEAFRLLKTLHVKIVLVPLATVVGTLMAVGLVGSLLGLAPRESLAVGSGFGYYSLSSVLISQLHSDQLGVLALLVNVLREMITLLFAPLLVRAFGRLAPVVSGGATAMDTTLPAITTYSGEAYALIAMFNGLALTLLVPIVIPIILA